MSNPKLTKESMKRLKPLDKMTKKELENWLNWAENERMEYKWLIQKLKTELSLR